MYKEGKIVEVGCEILVDREKAVMVESDITGKKAWIPKSQCEIDPDGNVQLPLWLAQEKELI